jgi:heparin/heparan-sulfate lyase
MMNIKTTSVLKMKVCYLNVFLLLLMMPYSFANSIAKQPGNGIATKVKNQRYGAEAVKINLSSTEIVEDKLLSNGKGMTLKAGVKSALEGERPLADLVFTVKLPKAGRYIMRSYAVTDVEGAALMKKAKGKYESLFMRIQIDDHRATKRVVYVPWNRPLQTSGKFELTGQEQQIKIWLPRGVRLEYIEFAPYTPPVVPLEAQNYKPEIVPPSSRPRLWVNQQTLPKVKASLNEEEHKAAWAKVKKAALTPFVFKYDPNVEVAYNANLESAAENKAFYYLMTGDKTVGRESLELMSAYLSNVEFGNLLDITREMGRAIFTASEVYDWCYDLMTTAEKKVFCDNLMRLADDMEIGWPPFLQKIVNGHGNEAQVCRDLLSMSIAIYDENPLPYQYTSYAVLKELVPMRKFEYQSPRHNQGVNYGSYRFNWDMHAAWLFYGMTGKTVFDDNIKKVHHQWLYMRTPDGQMLRDGDGFSSGIPGKPFYWSAPSTMLLAYSYAADPILKADFQRQGGLPDNPVLFLLLNDPKLKADTSREILPLTKDFGPVLGAMIARTGWDFTDDSDDVVAEIKGGGYHAGNHQHSDAGSIQLYYRGFQFGDLGLYKFYGTPYDLNFNKRSISHSMMLAVDPNEKFLTSESNDGGTRFIQRNPKTPEESLTDPMFYNGKVLSADFGPTKLKPSFSYFSVDLTGAYSSKISAYNRNFLFLNLGRKDIPAAIILTDDMTTSNPEFKKYWQINSHHKPAITDNGFVLHNEHNGKVGKTHIEMLLPAMKDRKMEVLSGEDANSSFKFKYEAPVENLAEAKGSRIMVSPNNSYGKDRFLTVFQLTAGDVKPLSVKHFETKVSHVIILADRVVSMSNSNDLIDKKFILNIPSKGKYQVVLAGMKAGDWTVSGSNGKAKFNVNVEEGKHTVFFHASKGKYTITPGK